MHRTRTEIKSSILRLDLRRLIFLLTIATALSMAAAAFYASHQAQRTMLMQQTLESNRAYAVKLAHSVDDHLTQTQSQMAYSATLLSALVDDPKSLAREVERIRRQAASFNSVLVVDEDGILVAIAPSERLKAGIQLDSLGAHEALSVKRPTISAPYLSVSNKLVIFISHPLMDSSGNYRGYLGGTIHLHETSVLHSLLDTHFYRDGSQLYAVDKEGRIIYHEDNKRVGDYAPQNAAIRAVVYGRTGAAQIINSRGVSMLAGYAPVPQSG